MKPSNPMSPVCGWRQWLDFDRLVMVACLCAIPAGVFFATA
ncbi:MAG: hypothetical protein ACKO8O_14125 [Betaproteobacteria bacterium]